MAGEPTPLPFNPITAVYQVGKFLSGKKKPDPGPAYRIEVARARNIDPAAVAEIESAVQRLKDQARTPTGQRIAELRAMDFWLGTLRGIQVSPAAPPPPPPAPPAPPRGPQTRPTVDMTDSGVEARQASRERVDKVFSFSREGILRAIEINYLSAKPLPKPPPPKPRPRRAPKKKPPPRRRRPIRKPDKPVRFPRRLPGPIEIIRRALEMGRTGIDEVLRRVLEKERKGPTTRPPGGDRPGSPGRPDFPRVPVPTPEVVTEAQRLPKPEKQASQDRPQATIRVEPRVSPRIETGPIRIPQPQTLPQAQPLTWPLALPLASLAFLPKAGARGAGRQKPKPRPQKPPLRGFLEALQPLRAPKEELAEKCWTQCRKAGPKKKRKRRICITPAKAAKLGLTAVIRKAVG